MKWISLVMVFVSCAAAVSKPLLRLEDRELHIDYKGRGLIYFYNEYKCEYPRRWFNKKCKWYRREVIYDLSDDKMRDELIFKGFTCKSVNRFKY